jgi:hypothetical protein
VTSACVSTTAAEDSVPEQVFDDFASVRAKRRAMGRRDRLGPCVIAVRAVRVQQLAERTRRNAARIRASADDNASRTTKAHTPANTIAYDPEVE